MFSGYKKRCSHGWRYFYLTFYARILIGIFLAGFVLTSDARAQAPPTIPGIDGNKLSILIQSALSALNHANITNNYSVLRDLGTPSFKNKNSAKKLSQIFAKLRRRNLDLGPVMLFRPKLVAQPAIDKHGNLILRGFFPTRPQQVNFGLIYTKLNQRWWIEGISVNVVNAPAVQAKKKIDRPVSRLGGLKMPLPEKRPVRNATQNSSDVIATHDLSGTNASVPEPPKTKKPEKLKWWPF